MSSDRARGRQGDKDRLRRAPSTGLGSGNGEGELVRPCAARLTLTAEGVGRKIRGSFCGGVPKRPTGADCKSAGLCLRRFESYPLHQLWEEWVRSVPLALSGVRV